MSDLSNILQVMENIKEEYEKTEDKDKKLTISYKNIELETLSMNEIILLTDVFFKEETYNFFTYFNSGSLLKGSTISRYIKSSRVDQIPLHVLKEIDPHSNHLEVEDVVLLINTLILKGYKEVGHLFRFLESTPEYINDIHLNDLTIDYIIKYGTNINLGKIFTFDKVIFTELLKSKNIKRASLKVFTKEQVFFNINLLALKIIFGFSLSAYKPTQVLKVLCTQCISYIIKKKLLNRESAIRTLLLEYDNNISTIDSEEPSRCLFYEICTSYTLNLYKKGILTSSELEGLKTLPEYEIYRDLHVSKGGQPHLKYLSDKLTSFTTEGLQIFNKKLTLLPLKALKEVIHTSQSIDCLIPLFLEGGLPESITKTPGFHCKVDLYNLLTHIDTAPKSVQSRRLYLLMKPIMAQYNLYCPLTVLSLNLRLIQLSTDFKETPEMVSCLINYILKTTEDDFPEKELISLIRDIVYFIHEKTIPLSPTNESTLEVIYMKVVHLGERLGIKVKIRNLKSK